MENPFADTVILVTRDGMGDAPPDLQARLLENWCALMVDNGHMPGVIAFYADGVRVVTRASRTADLLRQIEKKGTRLIVCKTCIESYGLADQIQAGFIGSMADIQAALALARKVVTL